MRHIFILIGLIISGQALANDSDNAPEQSEVCQTCHGVDGNEVVDENTPRLAGQHYDYLVQALKSYRSGARENAIMAGFVQDLSDKDIDVLAKWYSSQDGLVDLRIR